MWRFHLQALLLALCAAMPLPGDNGTSPAPVVSTPDALLAGLIKACEKNDVAQAQLLIAQGAPVDAPYGGYHLTPLLVASGTSPGIVALLIDKKVRINQIDLQGNTALNRACYFKQQATALALLAAGADPSLANFHGRTPVGNATITGDDVLIKALAADPNLATKAGYTPLMRAAIKTPSALQDLIDHGAKLEARTNDGSTALILSCWANSEPNVHVLVEHGADINAADSKGETPLLCAGDLGAVNIVDYLKQKGATNTDVRILAKDTPTKPLSPDQRWALAVAALYVQITGYNPQILGWDGYSKRGARKGLASVWAITDKADLLAQIKDLVPPTRNLTELKDAAKLAATNEIEFKIMIAIMPSGAATATAMRRIYLKWNEKFGLGGDLCRAANLVNTGYQAGYLTEAECWSLLLDIARQTQAHFTSWQELADNFLDSREIWSGKRDPQFEACAKLLLNPKDPNSPWNQNPWNTPLPPP